MMKRKQLIGIFLILLLSLNFIPFTALSIKAANDESAITQVHQRGRELDIYLKDLPEGASDLEFSLGGTRLAKVDSNRLLNPEVDLRTVILIDDSKTAALSHERIIKVIEGVLEHAPDNESFAVYVAGKEVRVLSDYTKDKAKIKKIVSSIQYTDHPCYIIQNISTLSDQIFEDAQDRPSFDRVITFTDGGEKHPDERSWTSLNKLSSKQLMINMVYVAPYPYPKGENRRADGSGVLDKLADYSGGQIFDLENLSVEECVRALVLDYDIELASVSLPETAAFGSEVEITGQGIDSFNKVFSIKGCSYYLGEGLDDETVISRIDKEFIEVDDQGEEVDTGAESDKETRETVALEADSPEESKEIFEDEQVEEESSFKSFLNRHGKSKVLFALALLLLLIICIAWILSKNKKSETEDPLLSLNLDSMDDNDELDTSPSFEAGIVEEAAIQNLCLTNIEDGKAVLIEIQGESTVSLGRSREKNNISFSSEPSVSTIHCQFFRRNNKIFVRDLKSKNGTLLNSNRISSDTVLHPGDILQVGRLKFSVDIVKR